MDTMPGSTVAEVDRYIAEGSRLIAHAETCRQALIAGGAQQGHLLMAARTLAAMNRVQATMERQRAALRQSLVEAVHAPTVLLVAQPARPWWPLLGGRKAEVRSS
jgi:hypothetical protein